MKKLLYMMIVIPFLLLLGCGQSEQSSEGTTSEKKVRWKMASTFPGSLAQIGTLGVRLQDEVNKVSGGNINIKPIKSVAKPGKINNNAANVSAAPDIIS